MGELPDNFSFRLKNTMSLMNYETDPPLPRSDKIKSCALTTEKTYRSLTIQEQDMLQKFNNV